MNKRYRIGLFLLFVYFNCIGQSVPKEATSDEEAVKSVIRNMFEGLAELNPSKVHALTTTDFILLENGAIWNNDTISIKLNRTRSTYQSFKRINKIDFLRVQVEGNVAWACFYNEADIMMDSQKRNPHWLESAVLVRSGNSWKIRMFHSTVVPAQKQ